MSNKTTNPIIAELLSTHGFIAFRGDLVSNYGLLKLGSREAHVLRLEYLRVYDDKVKQEYRSQTMTLLTTLADKHNMTLN